MQRTQLSIRGLVRWMPFPAPKPWRHFEIRIPHRRVLTYFKFSVSDTLIWFFFHFWTTFDHVWDLLLTFCTNRYLAPVKDFVVYLRLGWLNLERENWAEALKYFDECAFKFLNKFSKILVLRGVDSQNILFVFVLINIYTHKLKNIYVHFFSKQK